MRGGLVLVGVLAVATVVGLLWRWGNGRVRTTRTTGTVTAEEIGAPALGERATFVQFSTAFCAPCRAARVVLGQVAEATPGVAHVEVDAESHLELVRRMGILRTPTTLLLDPAGCEVKRMSGAPRRDQAFAALNQL